MSKYVEIMDGTQKVFDDAIKITDLERVVNIKILANNGLKEIGKVVKANDLVKHMTNEDVIIVLNEKIFDKLDKTQKPIVADELVAAISYDFEHDRLSIAKPDIMVHSLILKKYGVDNCVELIEQIKLMFSQDKDDESAE